jgi:DNA polymerase III subunit epsilon
MFNEPVVFVDIETTGVSWKSCRIIEIAAIRIENDVLVDEFHTLVNPGQRLPQFITQLTGIVDADLESAPYFDEIAYDLTKIFDGALFIAHNVRFDYSFIKRQLEASGFKFRPKLLCTVRLSRALYPDAVGHSLEKVLKRHNITVSSRHRASEDARALWEFVKIAHHEHGEEVFTEAVAKQLKRMTLPPHVKPESVEQLTNKPGVYIFEDEEGKPVYIGKSVNIRNRVLSHFTADTKASKEMRIAQNTHSVSSIETDNELEALLLESKLVKEMLPVYNQQLRRAKSQSLIIKGYDNSGYIVMKVYNQSLDEADDLSMVYGVYQNRRKAKEALERHRHTFQLCPKLLGLEKSDKACFWYQLGKCKGACIGKESAGQYNMRVELALERSKIERWPFTTPVVLRVSDESDSAVVVDQWSIAGYLRNVVSGQPYFEKVSAAFDLDTYKILRGFMAKYKDSLKIMPFTDAL